MSEKLEEKNKQTDEKQEKMNALAAEVLKLARNTLLVNLRFMDHALSRLYVMPHKDARYLETDGRVLVYEARKVLETYKLESGATVRDYLHVILHCVYRHMFVNPLIDRRLWDLACDIAVEYCINDIALRATSLGRAERQKEKLLELSNKAKLLTAEKLYAYFRTERPDEKELAELEALFKADSHRLWYLTEEEKKAMGFVPKPKNGGDGDGGETWEELFGLSREEAVALWKSVSEHVEMDMELFCKLRGDGAAGMIQNLKEVNRERYDYTSFLKKFAVPGEALKINDDEFDYIYYTYGLELYEKVPLVEPLEYKEVKKIREFVIAIDTSGSTSGELVQRFVQKTYNILMSTESFFSKVNIHIIQCDADIQEDRRITSAQDFEEYLKTMKLRGHGGTDFRPVFGYVDRLIKSSEFTNLKGLIYFTDGLGIFPSKKPDYSTAFVFVDDKYNNYNVPSWAIKLILQKEDI